MVEDFKLNRRLAGADESGGTHRVSRDRVLAGIEARIQPFTDVMIL
jgi:hypothetical protein